MMRRPEALTAAVLFQWVQGLVLCLAGILVVFEAPRLSDHAYTDCSPGPGTSCGVLPFGSLLGCIVGAIVILVGAGLIASGFANFRGTPTALRTHLWLYVAAGLAFALPWLAWMFISDTSVVNLDWSIPVLMLGGIITFNPLVLLVLAILLRSAEVRRYRAEARGQA